MRTLPLLALALGAASVEGVSTRSLRAAQSNAASSQSHEKVAHVGAANVTVTAASVLQMLPKAECSWLLDETYGALRGWAPKEAPLKRMCMGLMKKSKSKADASQVCASFASAGVSAKLEAKSTGKKLPAVQKLKALWCSPEKKAALVQVQGKDKALPKQQEDDDMYGYALFRPVVYAWHRLTGTGSAHPTSLVSTSSNSTKEETDEDPLDELAAFASKGLHKLEGWWAQSSPPEGSSAGPSLLSSISESTRNLTVGSKDKAAHLANSSKLDVKEVLTMREDLLHAAAKAKGKHPVVKKSKKVNETAGAQPNVASLLSVGQTITGKMMPGSNPALAAADLATNHGKTLLDFAVRGASSLKNGFLNTLDFICDNQLGLSPPKSTKLKIVG